MYLHIYIERERERSMHIHAHKITCIYTSTCNCVVVFVYTYVYALGFRFMGVYTDVGTDVCMYVCTCMWTFMKWYWALWLFGTWVHAWVCQAVLDRTQNRTQIGAPDRVQIYTSNHAKHPCNPSKGDPRTLKSNSWVPPRRLRNVVGI